MVAKGPKTSSLNAELDIFLRQEVEHGKVIVVGHGAR
jgi:hypothetical protein